MTAEVFVNELEKLCPDKDVFFKNWGEVIDQYWIDMFFIKKISITDNEDEDVLRNLIDNYDVSAICFEDFRLFNKMKNVESLNAFCGASHSFLGY